MSIGEKIADSIPESVVKYAYEHPLVVTVITGTLVAVTMALSWTAMELDVRATQWRKAQIGEVQRAASEALGG